MLQNYIIGAFKPSCNISITFTDAKTRKQVTTNKEILILPRLLKNNSEKKNNCLLPTEYYFVLPRHKRWVFVFLGDDVTWYCGVLLTINFEDSHYYSILNCKFWIVSLVLGLLVVYITN